MKLRTIMLSLVFMLGMMLSVPVLAQQELVQGDVYYEDVSQLQANGDDVYFIMWYQGDPIFYNDWTFQYKQLPVRAPFIELLIGRNTPAGQYKLLLVSTRRGADVSDLRNWKAFEVREIRILACNGFGSFSVRCPSGQ